MTPTEVIDMFDKATEGLQVSRQAHVQIQQIVQGLRGAVARAEEPKSDPKKKAVEKTVKETDKPTK